MPTLNAQVMSAMLAGFAEEQEVGRGKRILLMLDGAGVAQRQRGEVPRRDRVRAAAAVLARASARGAPLWELCDEPLVNRRFAELEATLSERCPRALRTDRKNPK